MVVAQKVKCKNCGVNRTLLKEMLQEKPTFEDGVFLETENHATARHIIESCPECKEYFSAIS